MNKLLLAGFAVLALSSCSNAPLSDEEIERALEVEQQICRSMPEQCEMGPDGKMRYVPEYERKFPKRN